MAGAHYQVRVHGYLNEEWSAWFDGWAIVHEAGGSTLLDGRAADQAALFGVLLKVRDLGLTLLAVTRTDPPPACAA